MTEITIKDFETEDELGTVTDDGELHTDDEFLADIAKEMSDEGGIEIMTSGGDSRTEAYGDWLITPDDPGFLRAFIEYLPSPYSVDRTELRGLPQYEPPDEEVPMGDVDKAAERAAESVLTVIEKEWVQDPSPDAETMRWRNTDTGEYRYQENKPASGEGGDDEPAEGTAAGEQFRSPTVDTEDLEEGMVFDAPSYEGNVEIVDVTDDGVEVEDLETGNRFVYSYHNEKDLLVDFVTSGDLVEEPEEEVNWGTIDGTVFREVDPSSLNFGDLVIAHGQQFEVAEQGTFEAPDGSEQIALLMDDGNVYTTDVEHVQGRAMPSMDVGDYDIETEWDAKFANSIESGEFHETGGDAFMGVRDIQHHASDVENQDLLADAASLEMDERGSEAALRALKGRIRALGGDPEQLIGTGRETEGATFGSDQYDLWADSYSPDTTTEQTILANFSGVEPGVSAKNMAVQEVEGFDKKAFMTDYSGDILGDRGMGDMYRDEIIVTGHFARKAGNEGNVVPVAHDEEDGEWTSVMEFGNGTPAEEVSNMPDEWSENVDGDDLLDKFGVMALAGMTDLHSNNVMVSEEGEVGFHDLDHGTSHIKRGKEHETDTYKTADRSAATVAQILAPREYDDLPQAIQNRVDRDTWEETDPFERRFKGAINDAVARSITNRARRKAIRLVEDSDNPLDEYFYDPDEGYANRQEEMNETLRDNLKWAYDDATAESVDWEEKV